MVTALTQPRHEGKRIDRDRAEAEYAQHAAEHRQLERILALLPLCVLRHLGLQRLARFDGGAEAVDERLLPSLCLADLSAWDADRLAAAASVSGVRVLAAMPRAYRRR